MSGDLFIKKMQNETIELFREKFCSTLSVPHGEQRFSDNYAEGTYFRMDCLGVRAQIEVADDSEVTDFDYHVHFRARLRASADDTTTMEGIAYLVSVELASIGYEVLRLSPDLENPTGSRIRRRCIATDPDSPPKLVRE